MGGKITEIRDAHRAVKAADAAILADQESRGGVTGGVEDETYLKLHEDYYAARRARDDLIADTICGRGGR